MILQQLGIQGIAALFGALLFGLHPVQVEAVAWASALKDTLSTFFLFSALLVFLSSARPISVQRLFSGLEIQPQMAAIGKDPKTELQELLQGRKLPVPNYKVVATVGAAHKQTFDVECEVPSMNLRERGIGGSRRAGEQAAAAAMLVNLKAK